MSRRKRDRPDPDTDETSPILAYAMIGLGVAVIVAGLIVQ